MKKFLLLTILAGVFTLMSTTTVDAQQNLDNRTNCPVEFFVVFGTPACAFAGFTSVVVPALSVVSVTPPAGTEIIAARTSYPPGVNCPIFVSQYGCFGFPNTASSTCGVACGSYRAITFDYGVIAF